jgi:TorA maturation chaperone TorD
MQVDAQMPEGRQRADVAAVRRDVYAFAAGLLTEAPTEEAIAAIRGETGDVLFAPFNDDGLADWFRAAAGERPLPELRQEFWDLFVVPGNRFVTPFESVFCDVREIAGEMVGGLMMGGSAIAVEKAYRAEGFERSDARPLPPDHVAIELAFMSRLCEAEREAWERGEDSEAVRVCGVARKFADEHLARWLPALREKVEGCAVVSFYPALLAVVSRFIDADRLYLAGATVVGVG